MSDVACSLGTVCRRTVVLVTVALAAAAVIAPSASASEILTRNAKNLRLVVGDKYTVVHYTRAGRPYHVLVWGAVNARAPSREVKQVHFKIDFSGGYGTFGRPVWKSVRNQCGRYDGPALPMLVAACKAPNGSYWAIQVWRRMLPNLGLDPWKASQTVREFHISHWTGALPKLEIYRDWVYSQRYHHLFGKFTYKGEPVHGYVHTASGNPLDTYGRNVYVDTYNSAYGAGWKRENSFLAHNPRGNFCYGFYSHERYAGYPAGPRRPEGNGEKYRAHAMGPGVTPVVGWRGNGLPDYDENNPDHVNHELSMRTLEDLIHGNDATCDAR